MVYFYVLLNISLLYICVYSYTNTTIMRCAVFGCNSDNRYKTTSKYSFFFVFFVMLKYISNTQKNCSVAINVMQILPIFVPCTFKKNSMKELSLSQGYEGRYLMVVNLKRMRFPF